MLAIWILVIIFFAFMVYRCIILSLPEDKINFYVDVLSKITFLIILIGVFLNIIILHSHYHVMSFILETLSKDSNKCTDNYYIAQNRAGQIFQTFNQYYQGYETYKSKVEQYYNILFENLLIRLLKGHELNQSIDNQLMEEYNFDIINNEFIFILFNVSLEIDQTDGEKIKTTNNFIKDNFTSYIQLKYKCYYTEIDKQIAFFILSDKVSLGTAISYIEIERMTKLMKENIQRRFNIEPWVYVSGVKNGIPGCKKAYDQGIEALHKAYLEGNEERILLYSDNWKKQHPKSKEHLWFKYEYRFINEINDGDYESASKTFNELLKSDYISSATSLNIAYIRFFGILNTMFNALGEVRLSVDTDFFNKLDAQRLLLECKSLPEIESVARKIFETINDYLIENQKLESENKMQRITKYIEENYRDPNLNAVEIAEKFNMNPSYFSRIFKETLGIGFVDYVSRLRIKEACRLLKETDLTISKIAESVGYNSDMTLSRTFKKIKGTTPGRYRQNYTYKKETTL